MAWVLMVIAVVSGVLAGVLCYAVGIRKMLVLTPIQAAISFGVTYAIAAGMARDAGEPDPGLMLTCGLLALAVPITWLAMSARSALARQNSTGSSTT